jgi:hypothetical protein
MTRAAVAPGTTVQATFAAPLVITNYINDFLELLRPETLLGRIQGCATSPSTCRCPRRRPAARTSGSARAR